MDIEFSLKPKSDDLIGAYSAIRKIDMIRRFTFRISIVLLLLCLLAGNIVPEQVNTVLSIMFVFILSLLLLPSFQSIQFSRYYKTKSDKYFEEQKYIFSDEMLEIESASKKVSLGWNVIDSVIKKEDYYLICSKFTTIVVFLRYMNSDQIKDIEKVFRNNSEEYKFKLLTKK